MENILEKPDMVFSDYGTTDEHTERLHIPTMLTIKETEARFGLPVHLVRTKVNAGEIVAIKAGRKYLINAERFAEYLNTNTVMPTVEQALERKSLKKPIYIK